MALSKSQPVFTIEEYLALERSSDERHEYLDGMIYAMSGESGEHADISANLVFLLVGQLKGKDCRARSKDTKVRSGPEPKPQKSTSGLYSYPDIVVVCGTPQYHDEHADVIVNPKAILEVLSPTTEAFDRGEKFRRYQLWNQTLEDYILVSQNRPQVEHYSLQPDGNWSYVRAEGLDAEVLISSIDCNLKLAEVYDRVIFLST